VIALQFLGGGRMAEALIGGLWAAGGPAVAGGPVGVVEIDPGRRRHLGTTFDGLVVLEAPQECDGLVLATKPPDAPPALAAAAAIGVRRVLSIAAGVRCAALEAAVPAGTPVVRAMPNTPALVGRGASAICAGTSAGGADLDWAESILGAVGIVVRVPEHQMDAVTGLSGSGPAYLFLVAEAMVEAGVHVGLPRDVADALTRQTLLGAATLLAADEDAPGPPRAIEELRAAVTSPGGTTAAGLRVLEDRAVRAAVLAAVEAAARRSAELG
jgi:pyrroline-5-carboxylate reductase